MAARHRRDVLGEIRDWRTAGQPVAVVSTQLIEAGCGRPAARPGRCDPSRATRRLHTVSETSQNLWWSEQVSRRLFKRGTGGAGPPPTPSHVRAFLDEAGSLPAPPAAQAWKVAPDHVCRTRSEGHRPVLPGRSTASSPRRVLQSAARRTGNSDCSAANKRWAQAVKPGRRLNVSSAGATALPAATRRQRILYWLWLSAQVSPPP